MRIVVLDGYAANPGDLSWAPLEALGDCTIHDRTPPEQTVARAAGADIVLTNKVVLDAPTIAALPKLRYIGLQSTGCNVVDLPAAAARGIVVANVPAYATRSVAQQVVALLLELTNRAGQLSRTVHDGRWSGCEDFCYWDGDLIELDGLTMGIVGLGAIGRATAALATAFGMNVVAYNPSPRDVPGVERVSLAEVFSRSDVVSFHCPLTADNAGFVNAALLSRMKPSAFLINTGRGGLINERDVAAALKAGKLAGVGVDVLSTEPPSADNPLLGAPHCVITPHVAWATTAARARLLHTVVENVRAFLAGSPRNVVN